MRWSPSVWLLLAVAVGARGQDQSAAAARAFAAGEFATALQGYLQAVDLPGSAPGPLLYNAGLCASRLGQPVQAQWLWRRAALHIPRHPELRSQLQANQDRLGTQDWTAPTTPPAIWFAALNGRELLALAVLLQVIGWTAALLGRRVWRGLGAVLLLMGLWAGIEMATRSLSASRHAVVQAAEARVSSEPRADAPVGSVLRAGEVVIVDTAGAGEFVAMHHPRGAGYLRRDALLIVD